MKRTQVIWPHFASIILLAAVSANPAQENTKQPEWWQEPRRMIQTNLREIDARMDLEAYIRSLKEANANVVLFNVGGIVANYPTALPYHYRNPHMSGDLTQTVVEQLHAAGIRVIGRFDFSKINQAIAAEHPEWVSRDRNGAPFPAYNDQVPVCLNGGYQQQAMFEILSEALDRYPLDGIFFNMIGYPRSDYSGRNLGICQCAGCRQRFHQRHGLELPKEEDLASPAYRTYQEFCRRTVDEQFQRVHRLAKSKNPKLAVCTYTSEGVDVIRSESNTPHSQWTYEESEKARRVLLANPGKMLANTAVHFFHYPHRHSAVSAALTRRRIAQSMFNGAWLDFYCIGPFHSQEDRFGLEEVRDLFGFHAANEQWLIRTKELADVGLASSGPKEDFRGLYKILAESHYSFALADLARSDLSRFPALVVPTLEDLDSAITSRLDQYVANGGRLLLTGASPGSFQSLRLKSPVQPIREAAGTYIRIGPEDKKRLKRPLLEKVDLVFLDGALGQAEPEASQKLLRYIPPAMFGPPEKCYYTNVSEIPCLHLIQSGSGSVAWFPWRIGAHYERQGHPGHAELVLGTLDHLLEVRRKVEVNAGPLLEMNHRGDGAKTFEWVSLYNHSGQLEKVHHAPIPMVNVKVTVHPREKVKNARLLKSGEDLDFKTNSDGSVTCLIPKVEAWEIALFEY